MLRTEEQAKECWCPLVRAVTNTPDDNAPRNAIIAYRENEDWARFRNPEHARCIGSACMAWRSYPPQIKEMALDVGEEPEPNAKAKGWETPTTLLSGRVLWVKTSGPRGYCGLAGRPE